jgi:uncharacterized protein involved in oxidation of intracellular sulfur
MKILLILNDAPYGTERTYNGLRLAGSLCRSERASVRVFLIGDAAAAAHKGQKVPNGYYNVETMLGAVSRHGGEIGVCSSCMDARGLRDEDLVAGAHRSSMEELTRWTLEADKTLVF